MADESPHVILSQDIINCTWFLRSTTVRECPPPFFHLKHINSDVVMFGFLHKTSRLVMVYGNVTTGSGWNLYENKWGKLSGLILLTHTHTQALAQTQSIMVPWTAHRVQVADKFSHFSNAYIPLARWLCPGLSVSLWVYTARQPRRGWQGDIQGFTALTDTHREMNQVVFVSLDKRL